jgi:hypothetical protein
MLHLNAFARGMYILFQHASHIYAMSVPFVNGANRKQKNLLPDSLDEYENGNNLARFIEAFVDRLDIVSLLLMFCMPGVTGRPPYNTGYILRPHIYSYPNGYVREESPTGNKQEHGSHLAHEEIQARP